MNSHRKLSISACGAKCQALRSCKVQASAEIAPNVKLSEVARYVQGPSKFQQNGSIGPPNSCKATAAHSAASNAAVFVAVVVAAAVVAAVDADDGGS